MPTQAAPNLIGLVEKQQLLPATRLHDFNRQATGMLNTVLMFFLM
jgi:hypothetical protein